MKDNMNEDFLSRYGIAFLLVVGSGLVLVCLRVDQLHQFADPLIVCLSVIGPFAAWRHQSTAACMFTLLFLILSCNVESRNVYTVLGGIIVVGLIVARGGRILVGGFFGIILCYIAVTEPFQGQFYPNDFEETVVMIALIFGSISAGSYVRSAERKNTEVEHKAEEAKKRQRDALVKTLHDSVASTLTSSVMRAENARYNDDITEELQAEMELLASENRKAIEEIRELIRILNMDSLEEVIAPISLGAQVDSMVELLESHGFTVIVEKDAAVPAKTYRKRLIDLPIMRELGSNVLKYGVPGSEVRVSIVAEKHGTVVSVKNEIGTTRQPSYLSTGLGLNQICNAVVNDGGEFTSSLDGDVWNVTWFIPD